jgi:hypothetical protein
VLAGAVRFVTALTSRPASSAQKADPIPRNVVPEAATTNVRAAASRPRSLLSAPDNDAASVPSNASPATAPTTFAGAVLTNVVNAPEISANTRNVQPAVLAAIQRR